MALAQIAGRQLEVDDEGFLKNPKDWSREYAEAVARELGIDLTPAHWKVIDFFRADFESTGQTPGLRRVTKVGGIPTKELYELFRGGPGKLAAKLAGLHKPTGCV